MRVSIIEGLDTKHTKAGAIFDGIVLNDISADGAVAIPRGATVQGRVVESKNSGPLGGHGDLTLELTQVNLAGRVYPIVSDTWSSTGRDKTGQTVGNAVGMGAFGALIGAVAGGGAGAAIGAAAGGAAGLGASAATGGARVVIPSEAILPFHLTQPAPVQTVSRGGDGSVGAQCAASAAPGASASAAGLLSSSVSAVRVLSALEEPLVYGKAEPFSGSAFSLFSMVREIERLVLDVKTRVGVHVRRS